MKNLSILLFALLACLNFCAGQPGTIPIAIGTPARLDHYLRRAEANGWSGSALVASGGKILLENGYGFADREAQKRQTAQTVFSVGSITKQFTAAAIMKLESIGKLHLDDPLSKYFPGAPADKSGITIHQLLTHSAGFRGALGDDYDNLNAEEFAKLALASELLQPPGKGYEYSNVGYSLLGIIVEKTSGTGYEKFLRENLWLPAGMTQTGYLLPKHQKDALAVGYQDGKRWGTALERPWSPDGPGWHLRANGGVLSTVGDMHRWYKALKNNVVLPKTATDLMFTPHVAEGPAGMSHYGYGWVVQDMDGKRLLWHNGGNGVYNANMSFLPDDDVCIVVSSNSNDKISDDIGMQLFAILSGKGEGLEEALAQRLSGSYRLPSGAVFNARIDENSNLTIFGTDGRAFRLFLADGSETPETMEPLARRTLALVENSRKGNCEDLAKALGVPLEEASNQSKTFWSEQEADLGAFRSAENFCTVARQKRGMVLAFVQLNFEKAAVFQMYVWKGDALLDMQLMQTPDKQFDHKEGLNFYAPNNDLNLVLEDKNPATLTLKTPKGDLVALRTGSLSKQAPGNQPVMVKEEGDYLNNPVTNHIFREISEKGAAHFSQNSQAILKNAGFDFDNDMQLLGVGERLMEAARWEEGIALYEVYTRLFPRIVVAWNQLGKCKKAMGDMPGARSAWEKSVSLRPNNNPAVNWLKE